VRVLYFIPTPHRLAGAARSNLELMTGLPAEVTPIAMLPAEGMVSEAYRRAGIQVEILPPGKHLASFGQAYRGWSPPR
jgi:hypothetical protein